MMEHQIIELAFIIYQTNVGADNTGNGGDIRYIKNLTGHYDIKTTERHLHVAREKLYFFQVR